MQSTTLSLTEKYRPRTLADLRGQGVAVRSLSSYLSQPFSGAFAFAGPTGVGKTAAAKIIARELGCAEEYQEAGGLFEVPSGRQDGLAVSSLLDSMRTRPLLGSGWRVAVVNEADCMTRAAEALWLDGLEALPQRSLIIFTTNDLTRLSARLVGRCEVVSFLGMPGEILGDLDEFVREVWLAETGLTLGLLPQGIGRTDPHSEALSFRLALQQIAPYARSGNPLPASFAPPLAAPAPQQNEAMKKFRADRSEAARKAAATRRRKTG